MLIRPSALSSFMRCEYLWWTRHVLGVTAVERAGARSRGSLFHKLLEITLQHYAETGVVFAYEGTTGEQMVAAACGELNRERGVVTPEDAARQCLAAIRYHVIALDLPSWEIVRLPDGRACLEIELEEKGWPTDADGIAHRLDLCMRNKATGKVWHIDFKTSKDNIARPHCIDRDYQLFFARRLLRTHGVHVDGSMLLYLRSQAPTPPPVVNVGKKNEGLSTAADQPCTWSIYEQALREGGYDASEPKYAAMREKLADNVFAKWVPDISDAQTERAMEAQLVAIAERMRVIEAEQSVPMRSFIHACRGGHGSHPCDFDAWCSAGMHTREGYDVRLLGARYVADHGSRLVGLGRALTNTTPEHDAYVQWCRKHGSPDHQPLQEFKP
jgi:hypothetical protein